MNPLRAFSTPFQNSAERPQLVLAGRRKRTRRVVSAFLSQCPNLPLRIQSRLSRLHHRCADDPTGIDRATTILGLMSPSLDNAFGIAARAVLCVDPTRSAVDVSAPPTVAVGKTLVQVHNRSTPSPLPIEAVIDNIASGIQFLAKASPEYLAWCEGVISDIVVLDGSDGKLVSSSHAQAPGQLSISAPASPIALAERLVHESTHQYFHLAEEYGPVHDSSDKNSYWSPIAKRYRTVDRILWALHAFANIDLFYRQCIEQRLDVDGYAGSSRIRHQREIEELRIAVEQSGALTSVGNDLFEPLVESFVC
jgi:HEXXH motif-containing protein